MTPRTFLCLLATTALVLPATALAESSKKPTPPEAVVYLQNVSAHNLGLAAVLIKTQEFGAKVASRNEASKLPAEVRADISDHLAKYVTVQMPQPYKARLLAFEVHGCSKDAALPLASAVAGAYLAKLYDIRIDENLSQIKAVNAELEARQKDREKLAADVAEATPAGVSSMATYSEQLRSRISGLTQDQLRLEAAKEQATAALEAIKKPAASIPQVRAVLEQDSILGELRRQKDAITYGTATVKDPQAQTEKLDASIAKRTKDLTDSKLASLKTEADEQLSTATDQLADVEKRLDAEQAKAKLIEPAMRKVQALSDRQYGLAQVISRLEERLTELRLQSDSNQDQPKYLGKSTGEP